MKRDLAIVAALLSACTLSALPALLNAAGTHSDAAIVGLQAKHLLHGEWSWFLWGSGYQTSVDAWVAAAFFGVLGPSPTALMLSAFVDYLAMVVLVYATLRRSFAPLHAVALVSPLVLIAAPVHTYAFYPPRQAAFTVFFAGVFLMDRARIRAAKGSQGARAALHLWVGGLLMGLSTFADPYCLLLLPPGLLLLVWTAWEASRTGARRRAVVLALLGLGIGVAPFLMLTNSPGALHGVYGFHREVLSHNRALLLDTCLPALLSTRVTVSSVPGHEIWAPPGWFRWVERAGAAALVSGILLGGLLGLLRRRSDVRALGVAGAAMLPLTLGAFLFSVMVMDRFSARYLVAILLMAPFALAPLLERVGLRAFTVALAPYLASVAVGGWLSHGSNVSGIHIVRDAGEASDEHALAAFLASRRVDAGIADYWVAYRLTFLFREHPVIVPFHPELDRYAPYRRVVESARTVAYVFDPRRSAETLENRRELYEPGTPEFEPGFEERQVGRYTVLLLTRRKPAVPHVAAGPPSPTPGVRHL